VHFFECRDIEEAMELVHEAPVEPTIVLVICSIDQIKIVDKEPWARAGSPDVVELGEEVRLVRVLC
jgi:hypothetical protein